jgi:hypothetical protein
VSQSTTIPYRVLLVAEPYDNTQQGTCHLEKQSLDSLTLDRCKSIGLRRSKGSENTSWTTDPLRKASLNEQQRVNDYCGGLENTSFLV